MRLDTKYGGKCKCSISKWSEICQYPCVYMIPYINWKYTYKRQINGFKDCGLLAFVCRWSLKLQICILLNIVQSGHRWPAIWVDLISFCVLQVIHLSILHFISILSFAYEKAAFSSMEASKINSNAPLQMLILYLWTALKSLLHHCSSPLTKTVLVLVSHTEAWIVSEQCMERMLMKISHSQERLHLVLRMITDYITSKHLISNPSTINTALWCLSNYGSQIKSTVLSNLLILYLSYLRAQ